MNQFGLGNLTGSKPEPVAPFPAETSSHLKPIKTVHHYSPSHPELAFSPTDVGIWEVHKERKKPSSTEGQPESTTWGFGLWGK
jgi:hypothetical protein